MRKLKDYLYCYPNAYILSKKKKKKKKKENQKRSIIGLFVMTTKILNLRNDQLPRSCKGKNKAEIWRHFLSISFYKNKKIKNLLLYVTYVRRTFVAVTTIFHRLTMEQLNNSIYCRLIFNIL